MNKAQMSRRKIEMDSQSFKHD